MSETVEDTEIYLGSIVKAFGIKGELKFHGSDDFWPATLSSERLFGQRPSRSGSPVREAIALERSRPHGNSFVVKLEGVDDRNSADAMVGVEVYIDTNDLDVDLPDEELPFQVVGAEVVLEDGTAVGRVKSLMFSTAHNVYEVESARGVVLIPAIPEFVVTRDEHTITIRTIPGLIDG